jgi:hypothetical protein
VRRTQVRENSEQIVVGSDVVSRDLAITEDRNEVIHHVIGESPPINGIRDWFVGIVREDVRQ